MSMTTTLADERSGATTAGRPTPITIPTGLGRPGRAPVTRRRTAHPDAWAAAHPSTGAARWHLAAGAPVWAREAAACVVADDFAGARRVLARARAIAEHRGSARDGAALDQVELRLALYEGRLDEVRAGAEQAIATGTWRGEGGTGAVATGHAVLAIADAEQGALEEARRHLRSARRLAAFAEGSGAADLVMVAEATVAAADGCPEQALRAWAPLFADPGAWAEAVVAHPAMVAGACAAAVAAGRPALAARVIAGAERAAAAHGRPRALVATLAHARAAAAGGPMLSEPELAALAASPRRLLAAALHEEAARALEDAGERGRAVAVARAACGLYAECGASAALQRVRQWLRTRGVNLIPRQRRGRPSFGWEALSEGERRVVRLVAEGLTNRQIGDRLYLSRFTVDSHLRHVFAKLGLSSRVALTRAYLDRPAIGA
ncbi:MAG TPA: helix-turn-helix transcriptional regulator [Acidimicrobiales bacterium]|nr:helix-turn-helix transcriptional regulator [Acidimicrobiales bacterium]